MNIHFLYQFLQTQKQEHIISILNNIPSSERKDLLKQVEAIASQDFRELNSELISDTICAVKEMAFAGSKQEMQIGLKTLLENQTGCLIFAGGQATRLNTDQPKGCFSIWGKSLFEHICQWICAYNLAFRLSIPLIILVSKQNKKQIQKHFEDNACFGLCPKKIMLLEQGEYPFFDENRRWVIQEGKIWQAANGNGDIFEALQKKRAKQFLKDHRLQYLHMIPIDNALNDPLDINLLGHLQAEKLDGVIKAFIAKDPNEKVGRIYQEKKKHLIIDYMELSKEKKRQLIYANGGHYCIRLSSLFDLEKKRISLPYHFVKKKIDANLWGWKGEKFVFDLFPYFSKVSSLCYEKKQFFAPLKERKDLEEIESLFKQREETIAKNLKKSCQSKLTSKDLARYLTEFFYSL